MKRVAILSNQAFSLVNFRGELIKGLANSGHEVIAMAPDMTPELQIELMKLGAKPELVQLSRTGVNPLLEFFNMVLLAFRLRSMKPDVLLSYSIKPVIFGILAAWIVGVPLRVAMIEGLGYVFTPASEKMPLMRRTLGMLVRYLYRFTLKGAHTVIFLNHDDAQEFIKGHLVDESKVIVLGGIGVDLDLWVHVPPPSGVVCFMMVARLLREKGVYEFVTAAKMIKEKYPIARFVLLGGLDINPGALRREEVEKWVDAGVLEWPGHVDVKMWLKNCSVFVLPSYREGVPRSTQEAMSIGRAVISTNVPGCRETVDEGVNGFLVPVRNTAALAQAMLRFVESPSLIGAMGIESRRLAVERFDVNKVNLRLFAILGLV
jgi:glycosyltransferase involved in cell wall biosynthesis